MRACKLAGFVRNGLFLATIAGALCLPCPSIASPKRAALPRQFTFEIGPDAPLAELLPAPPPLAKVPAYWNEDLALVPEVMFGAPMPKDEKDTEKAMAHVIAKINHLNKKDPDGFMKALLASRADLRGLPFRMGKDCLTEECQTARFTKSVDLVRGLLRNIGQQDAEAASIPNEEYTLKLVDRAFTNTLAGKSSEEEPLRLDPDHGATVAAMVQMFGPTSYSFRAGLARHLAKVDHADATHALVQLALYAPEPTVRKCAIEGLKQRPKKEYVALLLSGFQYPYGPVARHTADALIQLDAREAIPQMIQALEQPDPRAPFRRQQDGKDVTVVRELVRVNHHRNCLLCHAPANVRGVPTEALRVAVPLPDRPLGSGGTGYGFRSSPDIFVRVDVTYLRQDFAMLMKVDNADPWPEMQRFDFFVRTRALTTAEGARYARQLAGETVPSHVAANRALRQLTGREPSEPTAASWRKLLELPAP